MFPGIINKLLQIASIHFWDLIIIILYNILYSIWQLTYSTADLVGMIMAIDFSQK